MAVGYLHTLIWIGNEPFTTLSKQPLSRDVQIHKAITKPIPLFSIRQPATGAWLNHFSMLQSLQFQNWVSGKLYSSRLIKRPIYPVHHLQFCYSKRLLTRKTPILRAPPTARAHALSPGVNLGNSHLRNDVVFLMTTNMKASEAAA